MHPGICYTYEEKFHKDFFLILLFHFFVFNWEVFFFAELLDRLGFVILLF